METAGKARGCGWVFFLGLMLVGSVWGSAMGAFVWILDDAKSTIETLEGFRPKIGSKVYSSDGELLGEFSIEQRQLASLSDIPLHTQKAIIATEDALFYQHKGIRPDAIVRSVLDAVLKGDARGGSTITQQVVRGIETLKVGTEVTVQRKVREWIVALQVERQFTKDEILELYLNQIFLGGSAYGVEMAAQQYYAKHARDLTLGESATLAGIIRSPNRNNPHVSMENAVNRRNIVLDQMLEHRLITQQEYTQAREEDLSAHVVSRERRAEMMQAENSSLSRANQFDAPYFVEEVRRMILSQYGKDKVFEDGLEIYTTVDMRLQRAAERVLFKAMDEFDAKQLAKLERQGKAAEFTPVTGSIVCLDNRAPYQGFVRALVGGRDFDVKKFNNATQARRQPGSSVKPFVWAAALDNGMTPSTTIVDAPFSRVGGNGKAWNPQNFDGKYNGPMSLRHALEKSVNVVAVKLIEQLGMPVVRSYMQRAGITTPINDEVGLTLALGSPDVFVIDMAVAYSVFPNQGVRYDPVYITEILNRDGLSRYDHNDHATREEAALDPRVAYVMTHMLQGVCEPDPKLGLYPTGHRTAALARPRGGKTGTTNENRNVWFCGFTPDYTTVVWLGYSDNRPLGAGKDYTGGKLAVPIWTEFMIAAEEGLPVRDFPVPEGVKFFDINRISGTAGGSYKEAYVAGTAPPAAYTPPPPEETPVPGTVPELAGSELLEPIALLAN